MKLSADYRALALDALRGRWKTAVLAGLIASVLGANIVSSSDRVISNMSRNTNGDTPGFAGLLSTGSGGVLAVLVVCILAWAVFTFIVSGAGAAFLWYNRVTKGAETMPEIIPIRDLKNTNVISQRCHETAEPIFVTKNGYGDMVIMSMEAYEHQQIMNEVYAKLATAEAQHEAGMGRPLADILKETGKKYAL